MKKEYMKEISWHPLVPRDYASTEKPIVLSDMLIKPKKMEKKNIFSLPRINNNVNGQIKWLPRPFLSVSGFICMTYCY